MTENTTTDPLRRVVPEGADALDDLTAQELGIVGAGLRLDGKTVDPYDAVAGGLRWSALARIAWVWAKRTDPHAKLQHYLDMKPAAVSEVLGLLDADTTDDDDDQAAEENPTVPAPAS